MSERLGRLRALLKERDLDAALITHPSNRRYLSGFSGEDDPPDETAGVLLITTDQALLLTSPNNVEWARSEAAEFSVIPWQRLWVGSVVEQINALGVHLLGFEDEAILHATVRDLTKSLDGAVQLAPLERAVDALRAVKDADELSMLERAILLTDEVFREVIGAIEPGNTEREIAWRIERAVRERGGEALAFPSIVASGLHSARPHHQVTDRRIAEGEPIIIDMGARVDGYNGDLTRTVWLGEPSDKLRDVYNVVHRAQGAALAVIKAGVTGASVDAAARAVIEAASYADGIVHGLGHGLGLRVHEAPGASPSAETPLQHGEVMTVEPGIYLPGWGGVRIEDVVVIQDTGCRVLTTAPKQQPSEVVSR